MAFTAKRGQNATINNFFYIFHISKNKSADGNKNLWILCDFPFTKLNFLGQPNEMSE
jgi:hypothetical protein